MAHSTSDIAVRLKRALRARGHLTEAECNAVCANAGGKPPSQIAGVAAVDGGYVLELEHNLLQRLPVHVADLPKPERVFYYEQRHRLPVKQTQTNTLLRRTALNATCRQSLLSAIGRHDAGAAMTDVAMEYPGAHGDALELCARNKAVIFGNRIWALPTGNAAVGALDSWMASFNSGK